MTTRPTRQLGLFDSTCLIVGIIIGAGIYQMAPDIAKGVGGPYGLMGIWVLGGVLSLCGALSYAELATAYPEEGGDYVFLSRAYGPWAGFLFGWAQLAIVRPGDIAMNEASSDWEEFVDGTELTFLRKLLRVHHAKRPKGEMSSSLEECAMTGENPSWSGLSEPPQVVAGYDGYSISLHHVRIRKQGNVLVGRQITIKLLSGSPPALTCYVQTVAYRQNPWNRNVLLQGETRMDVSEALVGQGNPLPRPTDVSELHFGGSRAGPSRRPA
jgi:hypothetical protein